MPVSPSFRSYVLEQLSPLGSVTARTMFGGLGLYHDGVFFGLVDDDVLYLKVDEVTRPAYERAGMKPFRPLGDEGPGMSYYEVPAEVLEDRAALREWAATAVAAARRRAAAKGKRRRPRG